jgi:glutamate formiminotransferase/formiminotetrahydrofolate cyclodeaminase
MGALKLPKGTNEEQQTRQAAIMIATLNAAHVPLDTVAHSVKVMELAAMCARDGNLNAISDAMSASALAHAALNAAAYNVKINLNSLEDKAAGETMLEELRDFEKKADKIEKEIKKTMEDRGGVS